jgi:hypothetical protein
MDVKKISAKLKTEKRNLSPENCKNDVKHFWAKIIDNILYFGLQTLKSTSYYIIRNIYAHISFIA